MIITDYRIRKESMSLQHYLKKKNERVEKSLFHRRISTLEAILTLENHCFAITNVIIDLEKIRTRC